jgi:hypothetical protein
MEVKKVFETLVTESILKAGHPRRFHCVSLIWWVCPKEEVNGDEAVLVFVCVFVRRGVVKICINEDDVYRTGLMHNMA